MRNRLGKQVQLSKDTFVIMALSDFSWNSIFSVGNKPLALYAFEISDSRILKD